MYNYFILFGLVSSLFYGISIVIKKKILTDTNISSYSFSLVETFVSAIFGALIVIIFNVNIFSDIYLTSILILCGLLYGISLIFYYYALEKDDATRVSQLCSLEVVIVPIAAIIILQESLSLESIFGICLIISAILLLSLDKNTIFNTVKFAFIPIFIALILWTIEDILMKYTLDFVSFLLVYFWVRFSSFVSLTIIFGSKKETRNEIKKLYYKLPKKQLYIFLIASIISSFGLLFAVITYSLGPLSIASPLVSSYPIFVAIFIYINYLYTGENIDKNISFSKQFTSSILFIFGIIIIQYFAI